MYFCEKKQRVSIWIVTWESIEFNGVFQKLQTCHILFSKLNFDFTFFLTNHYWNCKSYIWSDISLYTIKCSCVQNQYFIDDDSDDIKIKYPLGMDIQSPQEFKEEWDKIVEGHRKNFNGFMVDELDKNLTQVIWSSKKSTSYFLFHLIGGECYDILIQLLWARKSFICWQLLWNFLEIK